MDPLDGIAPACRTSSPSKCAPFPIDPMTNLPLLLCPDCKDVNFVAFIVRNPHIPNLGRRFFKCPRNQPRNNKTCSRYSF
ncbi:hypothetical protein BDA96_06G076800 [Sorghum bicolor]|uniref:Zinc finger GRF-type domain-containing protein n=2 Tax=Sorghum bicolor TaxID=4558 RepID=A0A1B6PKN7_SORBI|nr:hypothetical protein BDA96_06G076800 [Sorghum bicolor]KXG26225.1 hypothetical protein SORBI_3006G068500 [Sorghum bicolor]KXG26226.1 hypothetical protein SORBI_3006G068500 [Sorghum bicolor]